MLPDALLWSRIEAFELNIEGAKLPFCARLARDNGWTLDFAARVALEYKKFLYLACVADHIVTPSDEVDQAWHLHLTYSRSYWDELCGKVLQRPLHHEPTRGGQSENQKFENFYERTLSSYREIFGAEPPAEIWPASDFRFGQAPHFRRLNTRQFWIIAKPSFVVRPFRAPYFHSPNFRLENKIKLVPLLFALFLAGCAEMQSEGLNVFDWHGGPFLLFFWSLSALGLGFSVWRKNAELRPLDAIFPVQPLSAYEVAQLREGKDLATDVALVVLHQRGAVEVTERGTLRATGVAVPLTAFENAVLNCTISESSVLHVRRMMRPETAGIERKLRDMGLLVNSEIQRNADNWPLGITLSLLLIGAIKIGVGASRGRPVGFLALSCAVLLGVLIYFLTHPARRSHRGELLLKHISSQNSRSGLQIGNPEAMALHFALIGVASFPFPMQRAMRPPSSGSDGGSGCSSSSSGGDSGSGGGDGGGGCGGCGGD